MDHGIPVGNAAKAALGRYDLRMAGRRTPPLFDLLGRSAGQGVGLPKIGGRPGDAGQSPPPPPLPTPAHQNPNGNGSHVRMGATTIEKPVVRVELKPYQQPAHETPAPAPLTPAREAGLPPSRAPETTTFWTEVSGGRVWRVPTVAAYVIGCCVAGAVLITWFTAYKLGHKAGKDQMAEFVRGDAPKVVEPEGSLANAKNTKPPVVTPVPSPSGTKATTPPPAPANAGGGGSGLAPVMSVEQIVAGFKPGSTMTARGWLGGDPRKAGEYYLELVTLPQNEAARTVIFLAGKGQDAFALPVDGSGAGGNNGGSKFRLFVWPGLAQNDYEGNAKAKVEKEIANLGKVWSRDNKGTTDFRMPLWRKKT